ncbi:hypothetical protein [Variovorax sp. PAMC 28711]|uniref:hypothetical protein n=1 Tax=Variovorax sp. PAMC 28711 TaxID=1795631 RepID=UPI00078C3560|nr:hypothetical protein [Variovorax sp. PAMC 28711]AMM23019.1 hypothetical protein AX767_00445 [Variovorax sp. PAMC 28711]
MFAPNLAELNCFKQATANLNSRGNQARAVLAELDRAPACPRGMFTFEWHTDIDEPVVCHLEYEAAEEAQPYGDAPYPGCPESICLGAAYLKGVDILPLLSEEQVTRIETAALEERSEA